jgi:acetyl-CoA acetyltransferase
MTQAVICGAIRTPFGGYGDPLSSVRADDLAGLPMDVPAPPSTASAAPA